MQSAITSLYEAYDAQDMSTLWEGIVNGRDEHRPPEPSDLDITLPLQIKEEKEALDKCIFLMEHTKESLRKLGRGPITTEEEDMWHTMSVLTYLFVKNAYPLIKNECDDKGLFTTKRISELRDEHRGVYRILTDENGMKTGLSNTVYGGIIIRIFMQLQGLEYSDDDDDDNEEDDNKKAKLKEAREFLTELDEGSNRARARYYFDLKETMAIINKNQLLLEIITELAEISPAFYWHPTNSGKRNEELANYLMECCCGSFFTGFNYVLEMIFILGSEYLHKLLTLPSSELNEDAIKILRSVKKIDHIKLILSWEHSTQALRQKMLDTEDIELAKAIGAMVRPFYDDDPAGFLKLYEFQTLFNVKSLPFEDCFKSDTYAKVTKVAHAIINLLDSGENNLILNEIDKLFGLKRYDEPQEEDLHEKVNETIINAQNTVRPPGMITIENATKERISVTNIKEYDGDVKIKNHDGTVAGTIVSTTDVSKPSIMSIPSPHLIRGVGSTVQQRAINDQAFLAIMTCLSFADFFPRGVVEKQRRYSYAQFLWMEHIGKHSIGDVIADPKKKKLSGSTEKGRMVALPEGMSRVSTVREGVKFVAKVISRDTGEGPCIDSVVVACLVAELGLSNFAKMMKVVFGIDKTNTNYDIETEFSDWLVNVELEMQGNTTVNNLSERLAYADGHNDDTADAKRKAWLNNLL